MNRLSSTKKSARTVLGSRRARGGFTAKRLAKALRAIASELTASGHVAVSGKPYAATAVMRMIAA